MAGKRGEEVKSRLARTWCGDLRAEHVGQEVRLCGWVDRWRDHGGVVFIDLRDRTGIAQVVFDPQDAPLPEASTLRQEYVIEVQGKVRQRPDGMKNKNLPTGDVELTGLQLTVLNRAEPLPFPLHEDAPSDGAVDEQLRLKFRYLDLRRPALQRALRLRSEFLHVAREWYVENGFWEIETPILYKTTPEGARDYLVPSRVHPGKFYALPQSPQTLKQLCMVGGLDRYFQVARCFRDEDLRLDRQPEFTQIDVEMSFIEEEDIIGLHEKLLARVLDRVLKVKVATPFPRLRYADAMARFGSDKPDLRNPLELVDLSEQGKKSTFQVFQGALDRGCILKGLCFEEKEPLSRSELDVLPKKAATFGAKGIVWIRIKGPGDWQSPQAKFFDDALKKEVEAKLPFKQGAMLLLVCDKPKIVNNCLASLRDDFGARFGYTDEKAHNLAWITDFPLFEWDDESKRLFAAHHPFTAPHPEDRAQFLSSGAPTDDKSAQEALKIRARAYDLTWNGFEIGGGSLRIHESEVQSQMFRMLGIDAEEAELKFGFFLRALKYGTPPHGGIAFGVDRVAMLLAGASAIRDVMAFPKTAKASDLMAETPSQASDEQLGELHVRVELPKQPAKE